MISLTSMSGALSVEDLRVTVLVIVTGFRQDTLRILRWILTVLKGCGL
jgi:hypothetical protein